MSSNPTKRRPTLVTWLSVGVLILAAVQLVRFLAVLQLPDLDYVVPTWYFGVRNGIWCLITFGIGIGLLSGKPWVPKLIRAGALLLLVWYWMDRLLLVQSSFLRENFLLPALISLGGIILLFWILAKPQVRESFEE